MEPEKLPQQAPKLPEGNNHLNGQTPPVESPKVEKPVEGTPDLSKAINTAAADFSKSKPTEVKIKRRPGRPRKDSALRGESPQSLGQSPPAPQPPPDISNHIVAPLISISNIPAAKYNIPELALTKDEAERCAKALQEVLNAFVPDLGTMNPKTAAIMGAAITFGFVIVSKVQIYNMKIAVVVEETKQKDQQIIENAAPEIPIFGGQTADDYFSRPERKSAF